MNQLNPANSLCEAMGGGKERVTLVAYRPGHRLGQQNTPAQWMSLSAPELPGGSSAAEAVEDYPGILQACLLYTSDDADE